MAHNNHSHKFKNRRNDQVLPRSTYTVPLIASPNLNGKSAESRPRESSSQRAFGVGNQANERYVTFQLPQSTSRGNIKHSRISQRPGFSNDYEVTALDHQIGDHGGTTSTLDYLPHRLRLTKEKKPETLKGHIEELTREIGYLRQELAYYKDTRKVLMKFYESIDESHRMIGNALYETAKGVAIS